MMKKNILLVLALSLLALALVGCAAGNANTMGQTNSPAVTFTPGAATTNPSNSMAPMTTLAPAQNQTTGDMASGTLNGATSGATGGAASAMTPADTGKLAQKIAEAVEHISEIDDAEVIVEGNRALVAVEFEDQYSAGLDDRMKQLITETVRKTDDAITDVRITDDDTLYGQVKSLAERVGKATGLDELADDIGELWNRVTDK